MKIKLKGWRKEFKIRPLMDGNVQAVHQVPVVPVL